jgi:transcriptional regulator with XRE-family HTH domain
MHCGISAQELGQYLGMSQQHISRMELLDIPATPEHEKKLRKAMLRLIDRQIREIFRLRFYCKTHDGCLLEHMEENEHE